MEPIIIFLIVSVFAGYAALALPQDIYGLDIVMCCSTLCTVPVDVIILVLQVTAWLRYRVKVRIAYLY